jgi:phage shock protein A
VGGLSMIAAKLKEAITAALAPAADPRVTHLTSHQKQRALLKHVSVAIEQVSISKERLAGQAAEVRAKLPVLLERARAEMRAGHQAMARLALQRRQVAAIELQTLEKQLAEVENEEAGLSMIEQRLIIQVEAFAARQEVIKARYSAAEAQVRISEALTGVSQEFEDLAAALRRAEEKAESMQARATAIDRLVQDGDLEAATLSPDADSIDRRLSLAAADDEVDRQLAVLEKEVSSDAPG